MPMPVNGVWRTGEVGPNMQITFVPTAEAQAYFAGEDYSAQQLQLCKQIEVFKNQVDWNQGNNGKKPYKPK